MDNSYFAPGQLSTRFLCYFGQTGDLFADELLYPQNIEFALHRQLKAAGYERVVFYGYSKGAYFLDAESKELWHGKKDKKKPSQTKSLFDGHRQLKGNLLVHAVPAQNNRSPMSFNVGASEMLRFAETFLRDTSIRTAVVFPNGVEALKEFSALDQGKLLDNFFVRVTEKSIAQVDNTNTAVFIFNRTLAQMENILSERAKESLHNYLLAPGFSTWHHVGLAGKTEVRRALNYLRLWGDGEQRLQIDCGELEEISRVLSRTMAANHARQDEEKGNDPKLLQTWLLNDLLFFLRNRYLKPGKQLTLESCREFCRRGDEVPALQRLEALVGMEKVKNSIRTFVKDAALKKKEPVQEEGSRLDRGPMAGKKEIVNVHFTITGNQGTGKTTAAELIGEILCEAGLLATGQTVKTTPGELLSSAVGGSEQNLRQAVDRAMGGVLFIDEAYDLIKPEASGIVTQLLTEMESHKGEFSVILAGYRNQIEALFDPKTGANPGLKSRFGNQILHIDDYTVEELGQILRLKAKKQGLVLSEELEQLLPTFLHNLYYDKKRSGWANGREMEDLLQAMTVGKETNGILEVSMITEEYRQYTTGKAGEDALAELMQMIGLKKIKEDIQDLVLCIEEGDDPGPLHFLFEGPPGVGKTTVAEKLGKILQNIGVLNSGHTVSVKPDQMIAGFVGQTADKARAVFESAVDGVLFIDEAYGLIPNSQYSQDFGGKVIDLLLEYTDPGSKKPICVICAGYKDKLAELMRCNDGLSSRFTAIRFDSYSPEELIQILQVKLKKSSYRAEGAYLEAVLENVRENIEQFQLRYNGRGMEKYLIASQKKARRRCKAAFGKEIPPEEKKVLKKEDALTSKELSEVLNAD